MEGAYGSVGLVASVMFLVLIIITIVWYDPHYLKGIPKQVGQGDSHVDEGLFAVLKQEKRAMSAESLFSTAITDSLHRGSLLRSQELSLSTQSLSYHSSDNKPSETNSLRQPLTLQNSPNVAFDLLWSAENTSLLVHVARVTNLPSTFQNATVSYTVTIDKPGNESTTRTSNKFRKAAANTDCSQMFTFPVLLEEAQHSKVIIEFQARKSKHLLYCTLGELHYQVPPNLSPNKQISTCKPLVTKKQGDERIKEPRKESISGPIGSLWGELQILAQYQVTGHAKGRVKVMVIKGQSALVSKDSGSYRVEMIVKKERETQMTYNTKTRHGPKPIWKTPMIFDAAQEEMKNYEVDLSLVRVSRRKKSTTIGLTSLGLDASTAGKQQWHAIMTEPNKEVAMWHPITYADWL
ncbi:hypothetical protein SK128_001723 [Halocaridina rubra]|uniref:C2 domain-containing protein n=1 Tax=Halocaridina rubra TaxID=373956 RepID=A0AAN8XAU7_HALRR